MSAKNAYIAMLESPRTVFTIQELMMLTENYDKASLCSSLHYYKGKGLILNPRGGIYAKKGYDTTEMSCKLFYPCYISLRTVLRSKGVIFQWSTDISCICPLNRTISIDGQEYDYHRINPVLWADFAGIEQKEGYAIATPERAILDTMYLYPGICYFDNLNGIDKELLLKLSTSYKNKQLEKKALQLINGQ